LCLLVKKQMMLPADKADDPVALLHSKAAMFLSPLGKEEKAISVTDVWWPIDRRSVVAWPKK
jgi:hypothetical protein